jgi:ethanolamine-phosphate cytidylyltransferase
VIIASLSMSKPYHRVWCDGIYDLCHFGHFNMLRQVSELSDEVYVGLCNDEITTQFKGPPVFTQEERIEVVMSCKWATRAIPDAPWWTSLTVLDSLGCEMAVHGDDPCITDGVDCYQAIKDAGRFATVPRTKAISTTNLIGRMLRLPKEQLPESIDRAQLLGLAGDASALHTYLPTTKRIAQFSNAREPDRGDRVVYVDGTFDLLHPGHCSFLRKAKALGDYLIVGVHEGVGADQKVCAEVPIETLQERVLNVLAMKYVDDVIIGAPLTVTKELIAQLEPTLVVQGSSPTRANEEDAFRLPKQLGIFQQIESDYPEYTSKTVIRRVLENYQKYANRNKVKEASPVEVQFEGEQ